MAGGRGLVDCLLSGALPAIAGKLHPGGSEPSKIPRHMYSQRQGREQEVSGPDEREGRLCICTTYLHAVTTRNKGRRDFGVTGTARSFFILVFLLVGHVGRGVATSFKRQTGTCFILFCLFILFITSGSCGGKDATRRDHIVLSFPLSFSFFPHSCYFSLVKPGEKGGNTKKPTNHFLQPE